jgi:hypothetical protein
MGLVLAPSRTGYTSLVSKRRSHFGSPKTFWIHIRLRTRDKGLSLIIPERLLDVHRGDFYPTNFNVCLLLLHLELLYLRVSSLFS